MRAVLKASIAVVHQLKSQIPLFIPVNQPSQGLKWLTPPRDDALFWVVAVGMGVGWGWGGSFHHMKR